MAEGGVYIVSIHKPSSPSSDRQVGNFKPCRSVALTCIEKSEKEVHCSTKTVL